MKRILSTVLIILLAFPCLAQEKDPILSPFRDIYFISGIPLDREIDRSSADIKFQLSLKIKPIRISDEWKCFFAYTQITVWNAYGESAPFHDNSYMPGVYFQCRLPKDNLLTLGLEHRSNGRPYYGNPLAHEGYDDYSRGMNYILAEWQKTIGPHSITASLKAGVGCGVGDYQRHQEVFSQDLFLYYLGYASFSYRYDDSRWGAFISATPIWNRSIANVTAEASWRIAAKLPIHLFTQFHYGFDEALCDCVKDSPPPVSIRAGLKIF